MAAEVSRRQFLEMLCLLLAGVGCGVSGGPPRAPAIRDGLFRGKVIESTPLLALTSLYLERNPKEADAERLAATLFPGSIERADDELKRMLREGIYKDFEAGRTVSLDGWVLSVTEVRLWCLYRLLSS